MSVRIAPAGRTNNRPRDIAGQYINVALLSLMFILLISDTATRSYFSIIFFGDDAFGAFLKVSFGVILIFTAIACFQMDIIILAVFAAIVAFFVSYYLYFIIGAGRPTNFNSLGGYYGVLTVIVFYELAKRNLLPAAMKIIFFVYVAYLVAYTLLSLGDLVGIDISLASKKVTIDISDPSRRGRLYIFHGAAAYVAMYSASKLWEKFRIRYLMTFALAFFAAYLSMSRVFMICLVVVSLLFVVTRRLTLVQRFSFFGYLLVSAYLIFGIFDPSFNPYWFGATDSSTLAREYQYVTVAQYIREFPLFGVGLPDATEGLTQYLGRIIFPSDLGIVGVWFQFGIVGTAVIGGLAMYIICFQNIERSSAVLGEVNARTLSLTGCVIGLGGCHDLYVGMAILFSLIFANTLYNARLFAAIKRRSQRTFARFPPSRSRATPQQAPTVEPT